MKIKSIGSVDIHKDGQGQYEFYLAGVNYRLGMMNVASGITSQMLRTVADDMDAESKPQKAKSTKKGTK